MTVRGYIEEGANPATLPASPTTLQVDGATIGTEPIIDVITGANVTLVGAHDGANTRNKLTISAAAGGGGIGAVIFDSTLGADTASIDTGAGGVTAGYASLVVYALVRTDDVAATSSVDIVLNNDTGAKYDRERLTGGNVSVSAAPTLAATQWSLGVHGNGGGASFPGIVRMTIPAYDATTFFKIAECLNGRNDPTAGNDATEQNVLTFRDTAAITRLKVAAQGAAKLKTGSRLIVYGF